MVFDHNFNEVLVKVRLPHLRDHILIQPGVEFHLVDVKLYFEFNPMGFYPMLYLLDQLLNIVLPVVEHIHVLV